MAVCLGYQLSKLAARISEPHCRTASLLLDISVPWQRTAASRVNQSFSHQFSSPVHCIYFGSMSDIKLLQWELFVAHELVE